jgi:ABC-2 type transport system permease protein
MLALFKKEISEFFSSLTGYLVIIIFLLTTGLFAWVFPGNMNILESGYANIDTLFEIAPWVFLFLVPAITMRMFAEEKRTGTIELLYTRPLTDFQIVMAKYLAATVLVLFALIPTLVYFLSVYLLGNPVGNIDTGGTWGSFIGLFFLAASYVSFGLFASSLSGNQIISFMIALLLAFIFYIGFEYISNFFFTKQSFILSLGINDHYQSMSRGVIDSRDILYFLGVILIFILFTKTKLESRKW